MAEDQFGHRQPFGGRRGYCYNSDIYLQKALSLTEAMAKHYKDEKQIVVWQLDNEIGHEGSDMCYCKNCHEKFISYLKGKYDNIQQLNKRWGTSFWTGTMIGLKIFNFLKGLYSPESFFAFRVGKI